MSRDDMLEKQRQAAAKKLTEAYSKLTTATPIIKIKKTFSDGSSEIVPHQPNPPPTYNQYFSSEAKPGTALKPEVLFDGSTGGATEAGWHSIEAILKCAKEYQFRYVRGIHQPQFIMPDHFAIGALFHAGRARWFTLRFATDAKAWESIQQAVEEERELQRLPVRMVAEQKVLQYLTMYCNYWSKRPLPKPLAAEYKLGPAPLKEGDPFMLHRTARLDDASYYPEAGGALCLGESKTTSGSINDCVNQYTLHGQTLLQLVLWKMAEQGEKRHGPVKGIMLDVTQKPSGKNPAKFARTFIPVPQHALSWFVDALRVYLRAAAQIDWDSEVTRNVAMCTRMEGRARIPCEYRELCMHGKSASIRYVLRDGSSLLKHQPKPGVMRSPWE